MESGIVSWGVYVPAHRLARADIKAALGESPGRGCKAVACYDEDTTSLGVEAARIVLHDQVPNPRLLLFSTPQPAYSDKTNATAIHAALGLPDDVGAYDM